MGLPTKEEIVAGLRELVDLCQARSLAASSAEERAVWDRLILDCNERIAELA